MFPYYTHMSSVLCHTILEFVWKKLIALFSVYFHFQFHLSFFELSSEYFKLLQQFLLIFHFWEVFIFICLCRSTKILFPIVLWADLACFPSPAQHESGCAVLLLPVSAQNNDGDNSSAARASWAWVLLCRVDNVRGAWIYTRHCTSLCAEESFCWILMTLRHFLATFPHWCGIHL